MSNLTASQIAININFSGLQGIDAVWATVSDVKAAYFDAADLSTSSLDLLRALTRGASVLRAEGRDAEAAAVEGELSQLETEKVFTVGDHMDLYTERYGVEASALAF